ncbi:sugar phosphate isomerase/epimerase [Rheinheimera sp. 1928-s]|uniref:sugar phosphate isomerase/epimerase family protein n=1 Tax=Rheinheimera sp. 1928-s TaxID=3033803 RepID=UPI002619A9A2|nr:sugar phosphate isomerase/epimerase [Rheinheimera sp. 1928-s]MDF3124207.1 sugar phosphate isomerase/epimerase [Rheinheimera sp. 1928-s]
MPYDHSIFKQKPELLDQQRRKFLKLSALSLAGLSLASLPLSAETKVATTPAKVVPGLQLYTLRDLMSQSVADTLKLVAGVGYTQVEFAGYYDQSATQLKKIMDSEGLSAPSAHVPLDVMQKDLDKVIEQALVVGHKYLVLPYLMDTDRKTIDQYKALAAFLNKAGEKIQAAGMQLTYHNHDFEFFKLSGEVPYEVLLNETDAKLVQMELDLYWVVKAGLNPLDLFARQPGRFPLWHVKDMDKAGGFADVGKGVIDFKPIFAKAKQAGLKHAFVERDQTDNRVETIRQGFSALSTLLA